MNFTDASSGGPFSSWSWNFGDPASGGVLPVLKTLLILSQHQGTFTVTLQVTNSAGCNNQIQTDVTVY